MSPLGISLQSKDKKGFNHKKKNLGFLSAISPASMLKRVITKQGFTINPFTDLGGADFIGPDPHAVELSV